MRSREQNVNIVPDNQACTSKLPSSVDDVPSSQPQWHLFTLQKYFQSNNNINICLLFTAIFSNNSAAAWIDHFISDGHIILSILLFIHLSGWQRIIISTIITAFWHFYLYDISIHFPAFSLCEHRGMWTWRNVSFVALYGTPCMGHNMWIGIIMNEGPLDWPWLSWSDLAGVYSQ